MKQGLSGPKHGMAFRGKSWQLISIVAALFFCSVSSYAQTRAQLQDINAAGYNYKTAAFRVLLYVPEDTLSTADSGSIAYKNGTFYIKNTTRWGSWGKAVKLNDSTFTISGDTIQLRGGNTGGGSSANTSVGGGLRWVVVGTQNIKSLIAAYGFAADTTTSNVITVRADTTGSNGLVTRSELRDSTDRVTWPEKPIDFRPGANSSIPDTVYFRRGWAVVLAPDSSAMVDSFSVASRARVQKAIDSLGALIVAAGVSNQNFGSFFRLLIPGTQQIKTIASSASVVWDSTSNTNALTAKVDTFGIATRARVQKPVDSLGIVKLNISDTATAFNPYVRGSGAANQLAYYNATRSIVSDPNITIDAATNKIIADSTVMYRSRANSFLVNATDFIASADSAFGIGHSFMDGTAATVEDSCYWKRYASYTNLIYINRGVGGRGTYLAAATHNLYINPGHHAFTGMDAGFNEIRRNSYDRRTLNKIINGYKAVLVNQYAKSWVAAGNGAGVTRSGTWTTNYDGLSVGGKSNVNGAYTTVAGAYIEYAFTDSTCYWTGIGSDQSGGLFNYSDSADVYIDGVFRERISEANQYDGVSDGSNDNRRGPMGFMYTGLSYGAHTLRIVNRHSGNLLVIDGFGTLVAKRDAMPMVWLHQAYNDLTGFAASPALGSVRGIDSCNAKIDSVKATAPSWLPVFVSQTQAALDTLTDYFTDHIHPNDLGHRKDFQQIVSTYDPTQGKKNGDIKYNGSYFVGTLNGVDQAFQMGNSVFIDTTHFIYNNPATQQSAFFNIASSTASTINGRLIIGNTSLSGGVASFTNTLTSGQVFRQYPFSSKSYNIWSDNGLNTGNSTILMAGRLAVSRLNGGGETEYAVFDQSATYKLSLVGGYTNTTGDNLFNSSSGNTGIGTTPSAKLHVSGSVRFDLGSDATGDVFYRASGGSISRLAAGSTGDVLTISGGLPSWQAPSVADSKVLSDADYTVVTTDGVLILPDPAATRTLTLGAASGFQNRELTIVCKSSTTGEWILSGSYVQNGDTQLTENFTNSGLAANEVLRLRSCNNGGTWRWYKIN